MIITNSRYALVGYFFTSYPTRAHGIIVIYPFRVGCRPCIWNMKQRQCFDIGFDIPVADLGERPGPLILSKKRQNPGRKKSRQGKQKTNKTARLILREKRFRDTNMTRTDIAGSQQWTAVSPLLGLVSTV